MHGWRGIGHFFTALTATALTATALTATALTATGLTGVLAAAVAVLLAGAFATIRRLTG